MDTLRIGQGYTRSWTVTLRYGRGHASEGLPVTGVYSGAEALAAVLDDGSGAERTLNDSTSVWLSAADGTITLTLDNSDTSLIAVGRYGLSIRATVGGEPIEVYRAVLDVQLRPGLY